MKVYRVEYDNGIGPYQQGTDLASDLCWTHSGDRDHPVAQIKSREQVCGFRTMRDLFRWFGDWLPKIIADGAHVVTYDVPEDAIGYRDAYQLAFARATS